MARVHGSAGVASGRGHGLTTTASPGATKAGHAFRRGSMNGSKLLGAATKTENSHGFAEPAADIDGANKARAPAFLVQTAALSLLVVQNASVSVLVKQSRTVGADRFVPQTGVVLQEVLKALASFALAVASGEPLSGLVASPKEALAPGIPALLYLVQNNLQYVALAYVDPPTYTVTYQLKILSTALLSVLFLRRRLNSQKWLALIVLVLGVSMVQLSQSSSGVSPNSASDVGRDATAQLVGLIATLVACGISGLAGVFTEMMLKGSAVTLWIRNVQLAIYSIMFGCIGLVASRDFALVQEFGFFHGYNKWVWAAIVNNGLGGLIIAVVLKYADNILKNFATGLSIVLTTAASYWFMGIQVKPGFLWGVLAVCTSTVLYSGVVAVPPLCLPWRTKGNTPPLHAKFA